MKIENFGFLTVLKQCNWKKLFKNSSPHKSDLKKHMIARHVGTKSYQCPLCDEKFKWQSSVYKHKKAVHDKMENGECSKFGLVKIRKKYNGSQVWQKMVT